MKIFLPLLILVVVVAAKSGSSPSSDLAHVCGSEFRLFENKTFVATGILYSSIYLYMRPEPGFEGVSITVGTPDGEKYAAFFPKQDKCFQDEADWWQVLMESWPYNYTSDNTKQEGLHFRIRTNGCHSLCYHTAVVNKVADVNITAFGPSAWKVNYPDSRCKIIMLESNHEEERVPCRTYKSYSQGSDNTTATTTTTTTTTTTKPAATRRTDRPRPAIPTAPTRPAIPYYRSTNTASSTTTFFSSSLTFSLMVVVVPGIALSVVAALTVRLVLVVKGRKKKSNSSTPDNE